ncbi:T6SS immunity protein Tli4 family protein [Massilia sp. 2TAF26]|uniref:T6SS immunity protein Tli4 family protein n=1 Tax=Massilia sp. 2TAF26 TaxID=3233012 RepID=UPI003F9A58BE
MRRWLYVVISLMALGSMGSWAFSEARSMRDRSEVAHMTEKMKTVCVGRYVVDVPAQAEVSVSGSILDGFELVTVEESETAFRRRVAAREAAIEASQADPATNTEGGMVEAHDLRNAGMVGRTFLYGRSRGYLMKGDRRVYSESVSVDSHAHIGGVSVSLSADTTQESRVAEAEALLARIRRRGDDEVSSLPGFCVERAVFVDPLPVHSGEHIVMHLDLPEYPDLELSLASIAGARPGPGLLARIAETDARTTPDMMLRMTKLREGKRKINGVDGEEALLRAREYNLIKTYGFNWEAHGTPDDPALPYLSLELRTGISARPGGKPADTSLHEDALLALWDRIASSIRLRNPDKASRRPNSTSVDPRQPVAP